MTRDTFDGVRWAGHWVAHPAAEERALPSFALNTGHAAAAYERVSFRRRFELNEQVSTAPARLTADSRYELWVNRTLVGRGPVRSQPGRLHYDSYDIASRLRLGLNEVEVIVTYYGTQNAIWAPARRGAGIGDRATLVFEALIGAQRWVTDASWTATRLAEWTTLEGLEFKARVPFECLDLTVAGTGAAVPAEVQTVMHMGGMAESRPPTMPYGRLLPRSIGQLDGPFLRPSHVSTISGVALHTPAEQEAPVMRLQEFAQQGWQPTRAAYDSEKPVHVTAGQPTLIEFDFGRIVCGRVHYVINADTNVTVRMALLEKVFDPHAPQHVSGHIFRTTSGQVSFSSKEVNGFRYAIAILEAATDVDVRLSDLNVEEALYPFRGDHGFESEDEQLETLYEAARRTTQLNSHDALLDCPTREQRAWAGDFYVHGLVHLTCSDDPRLMRRSIELADSPRSDGLLPMAAAGDIEYLDNITIPDWSLYWVHALHLYFQYIGERDFIAAHVTSARRILDWFCQYWDSELNLLGQIPEWLLTDWSAVFLDGYSSIINGMFGRALTEYAEMSDWLGNAGDAAWARELHGRLAQGYEAFWDTERRLYIDHIAGRKGHDAVSQMGLASAAVSGLVPKERITFLVAALADTERTVYKNWIGDRGSYSTGRREAHIQGQQDIDWDTATQIVRAEPFGSAIVHDALLRAGAIRELVENIRGWSELLWDGNDTFGECWGFGTPCHGWSSSPASSLIRGLVGVSPAEPGFRSVHIAPRADIAGPFRASTPTPFGPVRVDARDGIARVESPVPGTFAGPDGTIVPFAAGIHEFAVEGVPA